MTEIDLECGHTKAALHVHGVNKFLTFYKRGKVISFSHLNSINFNDNFKDNLCGKSE